MINLNVLPKTCPVSWPDFCKNYPPYSIALDGFVSEGPKFDPTGPRSNLNHHEGVSRLETRATCAQVLMVIKQGLFDCYGGTDGHTAEVFVNDCDEDVCLSWFLLKHYSLVENTINPALGRLVQVEDLLDTTAGAYPLPDSLEYLEEHSWIFEPYRKFRQCGLLYNKDAEEYLHVIESVEARIMSHINGSAERLNIDSRYTVIGGGYKWSLVEEHGYQARTGMFNDGIKAYVCVRSRPNGNYTYTLGRMSQFIPFPLYELYDLLNKAEGLMGPDCWGGSDTIGGSPRVAGSGLTPHQVESIINEFLKGYVWRQV